MGVPTFYKHLYILIINVSVKDGFKQHSRNLFLSLLDILFHELLLLSSFPAFMVNKGRGGHMELSWLGTHSD